MAPSYTTLWAVLEFASFEPGDAEIICVKLVGMVFLTGLRI